MNTLHEKTSDDTWDQIHKETEKLKSSHAELLAFTKEVYETIGLIPAFGDDIGTKINKAQLGSLRYKALRITERNTK